MSGHVKRLSLVAGLVATLVLAGSAAGVTLRRTAGPCGLVVKGAPWTFKGQKGTAYTVVALDGASCATARTWVPRLTRERASFAMKPVPAGWHCSTTGGVTTGLAKSGQCTTRGGGIVEWLPKLKR